MILGPIQLEIVYDSMLLTKSFKKLLSTNLQNDKLFSEVKSLYLCFWKA